MLSSIERGIGIRFPGQAGNLLSNWMIISPYSCMAVPAVLSMHRLDTNRSSLLFLYNW